ncbi:MAG: PAS domain-containing protein, partial [Chitinophagaceae bacterium]
MNHVVSNSHSAMELFAAPGNAVGIVIINADGSIELLDCEALTGESYTEAELAALHIRQLLPILTPARLTNILGQSKGTEISFQQTPFQLKNENSLPVDLSVRVINPGTRHHLLVTAKHTVHSSNFQHSHSSKVHYQQILKQAPFGITILTGENFVVEMANDAYLSIAHREASKFVGRPLFEGMPEVRETVEPLLQAVLKTGVPYHGVEFPVPLTRSGKTELSYFDFLYYPLREPDGTISNIIVTVTDVTENIKAKHTLSESERQFRNLFIESPIAMAIFRGPEWVIEMGNERMHKEFWRRTEAETIGKKLLTVFPELVDQEYPAVLEQVYKTGVAAGMKEALVLIKASDGMRKFYVDYHY